MKEYSADKKGGDDSVPKAAVTPLKAAAEPKTNDIGRGLKASGERGALTGSAWSFGKMRAPGGPAEPQRALQGQNRSAGAAPTAAHVAARRRLNAKLVAQLKASTGIDLSHVFVETDPQLAQQGKAGAAIDGREIHVAPGHEEDAALLAHEAGHILQQQPLAQRVGAGQASPKEGGEGLEERAAKSGGTGAAGDDLETGSSMGAATDLEAEAEGVAAAVLGGERVEVRGIGSGVLYEEAEESEVDEEFVFDEEPVFVSTPEKGQRGGWHVVQPHESLSKVAAEWYGEQGKYSLIYNANREVIGDNPSAIGKGMRLFVPPLDIKDALQANIGESMAMANESSRDTGYPEAPVDSPNPSHELIEINGEFPNGYLDPDYWQYAGERWSFKLVDGASASAAVDSLFKGPTRLECESMLVAVLARSVKETVGPVVFDREFGAVGKSNQDLVIGTGKSHDLVKSRLYEMLDWPHPEHGDELLPGDMVWIATFDPNGPDKDRYRRKHPEGYWQGLNAVYLGKSGYEGFGFKGDLVKIKQVLFDNYNATPSNPKANNDQLENVNDVFGLVLEATVRLDEKPLSEMLK